MKQHKHLIKMFECFLLIVKHLSFLSHNDTALEYPEPQLSDLIKRHCL